MRRWLATAVLCLGLAALAGCGSGGSNGSSGSGTTGKASGGGVKLDLGDGTTITTKTNKPKIAFFRAGTTDQYQVAFNAGVAQEAQRLGLDVTSFDPQYDPSRQLDQVQNALQRGGFDAYLIVALDGNTMCPVLTRQAPAKGIAVVTSLTPICNRGLKPEGVEQWSPGTLAHVQNDSTVTEAEAWLEQIARRLPGHHTIAVLNGPPLITVAKAVKQAVAVTAKRHPNLDFKYMVDTDYTTATSLAKTQTLLKAHPEVDTIVSIYTDITVGAIRAIQAAGLQGKVKVFDQAGGRASIKAVEEGQLEMTTGHTPHENGVIALQTLADAFAGKRIPRYVGVYPPGASSGHPLVIDRSNVDSFEPQF